MEVFKLLQAGGPFMYATLGTSLVTLAVFIYKVIFLWFRATAPATLLPQVITFLEANEVPKALRLVGSSTTPMGQVLKSALARANRSEREIRRAVEGQALEEIPKVKGGTVYLPQLSNLATLFGLIGTIHGLIITFEGASAGDAAARQELLSKGISIAFYNTFFGLGVATFSVVLYLILLAKTNGIMALMEKSAALVVDAILWNRDAGNRRVA